MQDRHLRSIVGRRLHQHRNVEPRQAHGVGNRALVAEVGQRDDHAIDSVAILLKQSGAAFGFFVRLDRAVLAVLGAEHHAIHAGLGQRLDHLFAPDFANWSGKNPRFPMMTPIVIFLLDINFSLPIFIPDGLRSRRRYS